MARRVDHRFLSIPLLLGASACAAKPDLEVAPGRGLIAFDPNPPAGAVVYERPTPRPGDRCVLLRGGKVRQEFAVVAVDAEGSVVQDASRHAMRRDPELGLCGEWGPDGAPVRLLMPADVRYHWPLWIGKQWRCDFVDRTKGGPPLHQEVRYVVEALDRITVPAGSFDALRIVRTAMLQSDQGAFLDRSSITWFAPVPGIEVRQLIDGTTYELVEWTRGPQPAASAKSSGG